MNFLKSPQGSVMIFIIWITLILIIGYKLQLFKKNVLRFGVPNKGEKEIVFLGKKITSNKQIMGIILYTFINQMIQSHVTNQYNPFLTHYVMNDEKKIINMTQSSLLFLVNLENVFSWVSYFIDINILFTMELQFILPRMIASILMQNLSISQYMKSKQFNIKKNIGVV